MEQFFKKLHSLDCKMDEKSLQKLSGEEFIEKLKKLVNMVLEF